MKTKTKIANTSVAQCLNSQSSKDHKIYILLNFLSFFSFFYFEKYKVKVEEMKKNTKYLSLKLHSISFSIMLWDVKKSFAAS